MTDAPQAQSSIPQEASKPPKRATNAADSTDLDSSTKKRQKLHRNPGQQQTSVPIAQASTASKTATTQELTTTYTAQAQGGNQVGGPHCNSNIQGEAGDLAAEKVDNEDEDESLGVESDMESDNGAQLGNISIADSSEEVLSSAMLHALKAAIQRRLQQYKQPSMTADRKALKIAEASGSRWALQPGVCVCSVDTRTP